MKHKENFAKALYDLGKISFATLVIGQVVSNHTFHSVIFTIGFIFTILVFVIAYRIDRKGGN